MPSSLRREDVLGAVLGVAGVAYPVLVFFGLRYLPPVAIGLTLVALVLLRLVVGRRTVLNSIDVAVILGAGGVVLAMLVDPALAVRLHPLFVNLGLAAVFACSLIWPPSPIERIARLTEPDLSPEAVAYIRKVTWAWLCFFLFNATVSAWTIFYGSLEQWTLYNGLISYFLIGAMFAIEFVIRQRVRRQIGGRA